MIERKFGSEIIIARTSMANTRQTNTMFSRDLPDDNYIISL